MDLKQKFLVFGIAVLLVIFFAYAITVFHPEPEDNCYQTYDEKMVEPTPLESSAIDVCYKDRQTVLDSHNAIDFIVLAIVALLLLLAGKIFAEKEAIGLGLIGGGILLLIFTSIRYWGSVHKIIRLVLLFVALVALFLIAINKRKK